jgi:beta-lactamase class A
LGRRIDALLDGEPGVYGVVVATAGGEIRYARNADAPFVAASLYKPFVMAAVLEARAAGTLRLDEAILVEQAGWVTIDDALRAMITRSSNEAAVALYERVGIEAVNRVAADLGLEQTRMARDPTTLPGWPPAADRDDPAGASDRATRFVLDSASAGWVNVTTPREMARFFSLLLEGKVVNRRVSARMLQTLLRQEVDDRFPARLPKRTAIAHKTGNLPGVVHDAGVIYAPDGPVVLVALAEDVPDEARAVEVLQRVAAIVHRAHGGDDRRQRRREDGHDSAAAPVVIGPPPTPDDRATPIGD